MKLVSLVALFFCTGTVFAGGDYFPIEITEISTNNDKFSFKAIPTAERPWMDRECAEITVNGEYDSFKWLTSTKPMSHENHMQSIEYLLKSFTSKQSVNFGYIGGGLRKVAKCSYKSKGLVYEGYTNEYVLSVYDRI